VSLLAQALSRHENFRGSAGCAIVHLIQSHATVARTVSHHARASFVAGTLLVIYARFTVVDHLEANVVDHDRASAAGHARTAVPDSSGHTCAGFRRRTGDHAIAEAALFFGCDGGANGHLGVADSSDEHIEVRVTFHALRFAVGHGSGWANTGEGTDGSGRTLLHTIGARLAESSLRTANIVDGNLGVKATINK